MARASERARLFEDAITARYAVPVRRRNRMKSLIDSAAIAVSLIAPIASFAQSNAPATRAQLRAEIVRSKNVGYPVGDGDELEVKPLRPVLRT